MRYSGSLLNVDDTLEVDVPEHRDAVIGLIIPTHSSPDALLLEGQLAGEEEFRLLAWPSNQLATAMGAVHDSIQYVPQEWARLFTKLRIRKYGLGGETATAIPVVILVRGVGC
jgi:hypothetical protein